jgi:thioredoxin-related protein
MTADKQVHKKKLIDLYTDWCGWCKRMDANTFSDPKVADYVNEHFYPIKFNAEQKDSLVHDNYTFKFVENGRRGFHELAYSLLNGRMSYPSFVYLDENSKRILISPGYKDVNQMLTELKFLAEEIYKTESWEDFNSREQH